MIVVQQSPGFVEAWAFDAELSTQAVSLPLREGDIIYRLVYSESLPELELPVGQLPLANSGPRALDPPMLIQRAELAPNFTGEWQTLAWPVPSVAKIRLDLPERVPCIDITRTDVEVAPEELAFRFLLPLDDTRVLTHAKITGGGEQTFIVDISGSTPVSLPGLPDNIALRGAFRAPDGEIWLASRDAIWRGDMDSGFARVVDAPFSADRVLFTHTPDDTDLYLWTSDAELFRTDGSTLTALGSLDVGASDIPSASLAWTGSESVIATDGRTTDSLHYASNQLSTTRDSLQVYSMTRAPDGELYSGGGAGALRKWNGSAWLPVADVGGARLLTLVPLPGRALLVGGDGGGLWQYHIGPNHLCELESLASETIDGHALLKNGAVLLPRFRADDGTLNFLSWAE